MIFHTLDLVALGFFVVSWIAYALAVEWLFRDRRGLNAAMDTYREAWMMQTLAREVRIIDTQIVAALQNGTAFFASTTLLAVGGALTVLRSTDEILSVAGTLPFGIETTRTQWEAKAFGLAIIFVYAFFKFAWAYRLFNYVAILVGATPPVEEKDTPAAKAHARRTSLLCEEAGRHFNRGQRAFFLALGYLGWFVSSYVLIASTTAVLIVMWRRQFAPKARQAVLGE